MQVLNMKSCEDVKIEKFPYRGKKYDVKGYPTIIFIDSNEKKLDRIGGYVEPKVFLKRMKKVLSKFKETRKNPSINAKTKNIKGIINRIRGESDTAESFKIKVRPQILRLKPQIANIKARHKREVTPFFEVINPLLDIVKDIEDYERLFDFVEAIVAYHKYAGGRD